MAKKAVKTKKGQGGSKKEKGNSNSNNGSSASKSSGNEWNVLHLVVALLSLLVGTGLWNNLPSAETNAPRSDLFKADESPKYACDESFLADYLHEVPIPGLHVVCIQNAKNSLVFYKNAQHGHSVIVEDLKMQDWGKLKPMLVSHLGLSSEDALHQPWATFTPDGYKLLTETDASDASIHEFPKIGVFFVLQGGQWIWPGVRKGFKRNIQISNSPKSNDTATLETLSLFPLVLSVNFFLTEDECNFIQESAKPHMKYSAVTLMDHDKGRADTDFRTSQTHFLGSADKPELQIIDQRTASLVRMPTNHQEHVQVLRYGHSQNYVTHHDYFHPDLYSKDKNTLALIENGKKNRMATVFWYLNDVPKGGHTVFPRADKGPQPPNTDAWDVGLKVKPEHGKVIIFYSMTPDGELDPYSLHGAAPVEEGVKWAANKWVWNMPMPYTK